MSPPLNDERGELHAIDKVNLLQVLKVLTDEFFSSSLITPPPRLRAKMSEVSSTDKICNEIETRLRDLDHVIQATNSRKTVQKASQEMSRLIELQRQPDRAA